MALALVRLRPAAGGPGRERDEAADVVQLLANFERVHVAILNYMNYVALGTRMLPAGLRDALQAADLAGSGAWASGSRILQELTSTKGRAMAATGDEGVAAALRRAEDTLCGLRDAPGLGAASGGTKRGASYAQTRADVVVQLALLRLLARHVSGFGGARVRATAGRGSFVCGKSKGTDVQNSPPPRTQALTRSPQTTVAASPPPSRRNRLGERASRAQQSSPPSPLVPRLSRATPSPPHPPSRRRTASSCSLRCAPRVSGILRGVQGLGSEDGSAPRARGRPGSRAAALGKPACA
jgi:hypothetical protein